MVVALLPREMTFTSVALLSNLSNFVVLHRRSRWHFVCALVPCNDELARNACVLLVEQDLRVHRCL